MKPTGRREIDESRAGTVIGSDEVGFGAWAGPLVVAAVATPRDWSDPRVKDSKKLSEKVRETLYAEFWKPDGFPMSIQVVTPEEIDRQTVWKALVSAHEEAIRGTFWRLSEVNPLIVVDGNVPVELPGAVCLPKADDLIPAVSLASIIAKVTRDRIMRELDVTYPGYGFANHKGYGTLEHQVALKERGPCPAHRMSYDPVARARSHEPLGENWILDLFSGVPDP